MENSTQGKKDFGSRKQTPVKKKVRKNSRIYRDPGRNLERIPGDIRGMGSGERKKETDYLTVLTE